jgi:hypothetical protein
VKIKTKMKEERKKEEREKMNIVSLFVTTVGKGQVIGVFMWVWGPQNRLKNGK